MIIGLLGACLITASAENLPAQATAAPLCTANEMVWSPKQTVFTLIAPDDSQPKLRIYNAGEGGKPVKSINMRHTGKDTFTATLKGDMQGKFYTFDVGKGECPGIFAKAVGVNGRRAAVIDMTKTNPTDWDKDTFLPTRTPCDLVIYEMHHRDYSIDESANIKNGGKFLALTHFNAIQHLKDLGVNAVHFQPSFDFASVDESRLDVPQFNWGYDPVNYNVPDGSYSTDPYKPEVRIREFKEMVKSLHQAGIRVVMDVVLNHTMDIDNSNFHRTYPGYYYRTRKDGSYANASGCGNETASEKEYMRQYMIDSFKYWASEYHIDGFRVDLMGIHDIETMNQIMKAVKEINPSAFIYGEGWAAEAPVLPESQLAMKANTHLMPGIAAFSDEMRDALRGPFSDDKQTAFLGALPGNEESIKFGIAGGIDHPQVNLKKVNYAKNFWAKQPSQFIAYVSCHDDMCLTDRLRASIKGIDIHQLIRLDLLAQTAVFTSQGVPFMLAGEEMLRDKKGVHNSYNSPDSVNHLDWTNLRKYPQVFDYYRRLIFMRHNHPAFRLGDADLVRKHLEFMPTQDGVVAFRLKDNAGGDRWKDIVVVLNANNTDREIQLPFDDYTVVCRDGIIDEHGIQTVHDTKLIAGAQSATIVHCN
ncbi:MAG: type I pullulanase [Bacteroidaceae bacterium]|nr:type I pullulanase [Bacteroidaceae bacterium]